MTNALYQPFFNATRDVLKLMLDINSVANQGGDTGSCIAEDSGIRVAIGVTGDLGGEILYSFPNNTALEMVRIMSGMEFDAVDDFVTSAIGEIANIISGKALVFLSEQNVVCDILPPKVVSIDTEPADAVEQTGLNTCIITDIGTVGLNINLAQ